MSLQTLALLCLSAVKASAFGISAVPRVSRCLRRAAVLTLQQSDTKLDALHAWLEDNGISTAAVKGEAVPGYGISLVASKPIKAGDTLLSVPASLHITPAAVRESPIGQAVSDVIPADDADAYLALGLLGEMAKGEAGEMWPYVGALPGVDDLAGVPLLWPDEERERLFNGSHMAPSLAQQRQALLTQWVAIEQRTVPAHPRLFPPEVFNAAGYLWAHAIVSTRSLPFGDELSLIPFLDLANHVAGANNTCSIGVMDGEGSVAPAVDALQLEGKEAVAVLTAGADLQPGEQAFIDYGEAGWRSSWEMLTTYGFVPGASVPEWLASGGRPLYFEGVSPADPLLPQKQALLVALGADEGAVVGTWLDVRASASVCLSMAPLLRLAHLKPPEEGEEEAGQLDAFAKRLAAWSADPKELWTALQTPADEGTERRVAAQVVAQCEEALAVLPDVEELAKAAAPAPADGAPVDGALADERARLAARVLLGERNALETCIRVWQPALGS